MESKPTYDVGGIDQPNQDQVRAWLERDLVEHADVWQALADADKGETPEIEIARLYCQFAAIYQDMAYYMALPNGMYAHIVEGHVMARRGLLLGLDQYEIIHPDGLIKSIDQGIIILQAMQAAVRRIQK